MPTAPVELKLGKPPASVVLSQDGQQGEKVTDGDGAVAVECELGAICRINGPTASRRRQPTTRSCDRGIPAGGIHRAPLNAIDVKIAVAVRILGPPGGTADPTDRAHGVQGFVGDAVGQASA